MKIGTKTHIVTQYPIQPFRQNQELFHHWYFYRNNPLYVFQDIRIFVCFPASAACIYITDEYGKSTLSADSSQSGFRRVSDISGASRQTTGCWDWCCWQQDDITSKASFHIHSVSLKKFFLLKPLQNEHAGNEADFNVAHCCLDNHSRFCHTSGLCLISSQYRKGL